MNKYIIKIAQTQPDEKVLQKAKELGIPEDLVKPVSAPEKEIGVPYITDMSEVKFVIDRAKSSKYLPLGIIIPAKEEGGKIVDIEGRKVIEGEGDVPSDFYDNTINMINSINLLMSEISKLQDTTSRLREEYSRIIQPYINEMKTKEDSLHRLLLDLFWNMYNAQVKAVRVGDTYYTLKAQVERTGRLSKEKVRELVHILSKIIYRSYGVMFDVNTILQGLMGRKLVVELNRLGDISNLLQKTVSEPATTTTVPPQTTPSVPSGSVVKPTAETVEKASSLKVSDKDYTLWKERLEEDLKKLNSKYDAANIELDKILDAVRKLASGFEKV